MSCNSSNLSPCCAPNSVIVDEVCEVFNLSNGAAVTIWSDPIPREIIVTTNVDSSSTTTANSVTPGNGSCQRFANQTELVVTAGANGTATGKICISVFRVISKNS